MTTEFEIVDADAALHAEIVRRFEEFNRARTGWGAHTFSLVRRDADAIIAAARGVLNMGLVEIRGVWVEPGARGTGIGTRLMAAVECEAMRRGCTRAALDTYSWQAPGFYLRLGYREYGVLDYPNGTSRHYMAKELA